MREIYVTGFGPFEGVPENPSSFIVSQLANVKVLDYELEVSVDAVNDAVIKYTRVVREANLTVRPVIIHFGVATGAKTITLERCAKNVAMFRIPDIRGLWLRENKIINDGPALVKTTVDVDHLLSKADTTLVRSSEDAGEYLCNFLYYKSMLELAGFADVLFIHLPLFGEIPEDIQLECLNQLITLLRYSY